MCAQRQFAILLRPGECGERRRRSSRVQKSGNALRTQRIRVVDLPLVANQENPVYPRPAVQLFLGALLALLAALATGLALEIWNDPRTKLRVPASP